MAAGISATWGFPNEMRIGAGRINELSEACAEAGINRPLVVTDAALVELSVFDKIRAALDTEDFGYGLFTGACRLGNSAHGC